MIIKSRFKEYEVRFEENHVFLFSFFSEKDSFFVIDKNVYDLYKDSMFVGIPAERLYLLEALEDKKTIQTALDICEEMTKLAAKRNIHLVSVGGGITQDITGIVANLLYRGIRWTFVPTTLLASCDSCIGGKTSLNYKNYKNLLGTFYPPDEIIICTKALQTLTELDYLSGLGEVVKFNIMSGQDGIKKLERDIKQLIDRDTTCVAKYIETSLQFKKKYIEKDEFDRGIRIHLNFAHTFGHAIESITNYAIPHGTAVAMGTIIANRISVKRGIMHENLCKQMEGLLTKIIPDSYDVSGLDIDNIIDAIRKDKKQVNGQIRAVLLDGDFRLDIYTDLTVTELEFAYNYLKRVLHRKDG